MNECEKAKRADRQIDRETDKSRSRYTFFNVSYKRNAELVLSLFVVVVVVALSWTLGR